MSNPRRLRADGDGEGQQVFEYHVGTDSPAEDRECWSAPIEEFAGAVVAQTRPHRRTCPLHGPNCGPVPLSRLGAWFPVLLRGTGGDLEAATARSACP